MLPEAPSPVTHTFPFRTTLSLEPLIAYWKAGENSSNEGIALLSRSVGEQVAAADWVRGPITDISQLECHCDLVETLMLAVFPPASFALDIVGAVAPFQRHSFYHTPRFADVLLNSSNTIKQPLNITMQQLEGYTTRMAYQLILDQIYGVKLPLQGNVIFTVPDYSIGLYRHYGVEFNATFLEVKVVGDKPELTPEQLEFLSRNPHRTDLWLEQLPPEHFALEGFNILHLVDVTEQEILSELKYDLLERDVLQASDRLEQIQEKLRVLFGKPFLQLGIAAYDENKRAFVDFGRKINHSFLTKQLHNPDAGSGFRQIYGRLWADRRPLVLEDVEQADIPEDLRAQILGLGIRSAILALLPYGNDTVGLLELGSPNVGDLNEFSLENVNQFLPLFAVAVKRNAEDIQMRVQAIVKEKFTAIHPTMEWRFTDAAQNLLQQLEDGNRQAEMEDIVFHDVYPLHGSSDIRGSSTARNEAIQGDLIEHLTLAGKVLKKASEFQQLPILDELKFYVSKNLRRLRQGIISGDEVSIFESLRTEDGAAVRIPGPEHARTAARHCPVLGPNRPGAGYSVQAPPGLRGKHDAAQRRCGQLPRRGRRQGPGHVPALFPALQNRWRRIQHLRGGRPGRGQTIRPGISQKPAPLAAAHDGGSDAPHLCPQGHAAHAARNHPAHPHPQPAAEHPLPAGRAPVRRGRGLQHPLRNHQEAHRQGHYPGHRRAAHPARLPGLGLQPAARGRRVPRIPRLPPGPRPARRRNRGARTRRAPGRERPAGATREGEAGGEK